MSGGLAALLDDVATMAKMAAASVDDIAAAAGRASAKAAGVVVDDAAVTPRFVDGVHPSRELPMIRRIATGSLRNKVIIILPAALLLSQFAPWLLTPLLMLGGCYLCYEGAEKLWEYATGHGSGHAEQPVGVVGGDGEKAMVGNAVRTDFILSSEIMVIALNEVATEPLVSRAAILLAVAVAITAGVYGVVALIVKLDDVGVALIRRESPALTTLGRSLVAAMPIVLATLSFVGMIAMLWVGGHILLVGLDTLGWHAPYGWVHDLSETVSHATGAAGGLLGWLTNTAFSAVAGIAVGALIVGVAHLVPRRTPEAVPTTAPSAPDGDHTAS
ncbi:MAG: DUF808 domain-containing protein [Propioniciclava sp.]